MNEPFQRTHYGNNPGIVGARWWQESLELSGDPVARRQALQTLAVVGASLLGVGVIGSVACRSSGSDDQIVKRDALGMQRDYGWNFGAEAEPLTFDGQTYGAFDRAAVSAMATNLAPASPALKPYYVPTLFQSPAAMPKLTVQGATTPVKPLLDVLIPLNTAPMRESYRQGRSLAYLFDTTPADRAVIVDMPGPLSVAFAAGASQVFDPVFVLDNWPHPLGVVPAHHTLAAAAHYQPLFIKNSASRKAKAYPLFVLDRNRLATYTSENTEFDNRYVARVPSVENLKSLGIKRVLYVSPTYDARLEADDLNADFVEYAKAGIEVKMVSANDFRADPLSPPSPPAGVVAAGPDDWPPYYYGGSADSHFSFWNEVRWNPPPRPFKSAASSVSLLTTTYAPSPRTTPFSSSGTGATKSRPSTMGAVPVLIAAGTGVVVGAAVSRNGSYGRYSSSWGGG